MATIISREIRKRGLIGKICVAIFVAFNLLMAFVLVRYLIGAVPQVEAMGERPGVVGARAAVVTITLIILGAWGFGDLVFGMFVLMTRGTTMTIEERSPDRAERRDPTF